MWKLIINSVRMLVIMTVVLGLLYPLSMVGVSLLLFPTQANGSLIYRDGNPIGSKLIGQSFSSPGYFSSRPSSAGSGGYEAVSSGGSNLGPTNQKLIETVKGRLESVRKDNNLTGMASIPSDLVTASASGLDPHITPAGAYLQVERVAQARGITSQQVRQVIDSQIEKKQLGFLGEERVNVLELNLALDRLN